MGHVPATLAPVAMDVKSLTHDWSVSSWHFYLGLPGVICSGLIVVFLPLGVSWLAGISPLAGAVALVPWWWLLVRSRRTVAMLVFLLMPILAILGWLAVPLALHLAGVF